MLVFSTLLAVALASDHGHDHACQFWWPDYTTSPFAAISDGAGLELPLVAGYCYTFDTWYSCDCSSPDSTTLKGTAYSYTDKDCSEGATELTSQGLCYCGDDDYEDCADAKEYFDISNVTCVDSEEADEQWSMVIPYGCYWNSGSSLLMEISGDCEETKEDGHTLGSLSYEIFSSDDGDGLGSNCTYYEQREDSLSSMNITSVSADLGGEDCHDGTTTSIIEVECDGYKQLVSVFLVVLSGFIATIMM